MDTIPPGPPVNGGGLGYARTLGWVVALSLVLGWALPVRAVDVPLAHPVYEFLERMEARGLLAEPLSGARPWSRADVLRRLELVALHEQQLTRGEQSLLRRYRFEYEEAPLEINSRRLAYRNGRDLWMLRDDDWAVYANPVVRVQSEQRQGDTDRDLFVWASGFEVRGRVRHFGFLLRSTDAHVKGDLALADSTRFPYRYGPSKSGFDYDETDAFITWQSRYADVLFGKTRTAWGWGEGEGLGLSGSPTSQTQLRVKLKLGPLELTGVQAALRQSPAVITAIDTIATGVVRRQVAEKYLAAHRLQWNARRNLQVGLYETIVYGERGFDPEYLNPVMFLRSAEHYTGDRDNALMGADVKWTPLPRLSLYGELLMDDVITSRLGTGWYGNKLAYRGGVQFFDVPGLANTRLAVDYARVDPYVYSHKYSINSYQHYGTPLGQSEGPNREEWRASLTWTPSSRMRLEGLAVRTRHGANPASGRNVGGDFLRPWHKGDAERVTFLDGDLETRQTFVLRGDVEVLFNLYVMLEAHYGMLSTQFENGREENTTEWGQTVGVCWRPW